MTAAQYHTLEEWGKRTNLFHGAQKDITFFGFAFTKKEKPFYSDTFPASFLQVSFTYF